jgi:hypothetical protein
VLRCAPTTFPDGYANCGCANGRPHDAHSDCRTHGGPHWCPNKYVCSHGGSDGKSNERAHGHTSSNNGSANGNTNGCSNVYGADGNTDGHPNGNSCTDRRANARPHGCADYHLTNRCSNDPCANGCANLWHTNSCSNSRANSQ